MSYPYDGDARSPFVENKMVVDSQWPENEPCEVEMVTCPVCGKEVSRDIMCYSICDYCIVNLETFDNAVKYGAARPESVEINGYLAYEFTPDMINEILTREMQVACALGADPNYGAYIEDDQSDFESWLIEQNSK